MKRRTRHNPNLAAATLAPFMPYIVVGVVIYFFGDKIFAAIGSKLTGVSTDEYKKDVKTVTGATGSDLLDVVKYASNTALTAIGIGTSIDKKLAEQKAAKPVAVKILAGRPANYDSTNKTMVQAAMRSLGFVTSNAGQNLTAAQKEKNAAVMATIRSWGSTALGI